MTIWGWSSVGSMSHPIFILATLAFVAGILYVAHNSASVKSAAEFGALCGYLYGVAVWGSLGYYFDFNGETKLIFATMVLLDAVALAIVARLAMNWLEARRGTR